MARINHKTARNNGLRPCKPPEPISPKNENNQLCVLVGELKQQVKEQQKEIEKLKQIISENSENTDKMFDDLTDQINMKIMPHLHTHR